MTRLAFIGSAALAVIVVVAIALVAGSGSSGDDPVAASAVTTTTSAGVDPAAGDGSTTVPSTVPPTTSSPTTTLAAGATTTTAAPRSTAPSSTTTTTAPRSTGSGQPPTVSITAPGNLTRHQATYRASIDAFAATVTFSAAASDPEGGPVTLQWFGPGGGLGTGASVTATIRTETDVSQPVISVRATDQDGNVAQDAVQIIVWIPSDQ